MAGEQGEYIEQIEYKWKTGFPTHGKDPQKVGEALAALSAKFDDITPAAIVKAARSLASPLHPFIEWNERKGFAEYQLQQAAALRRSVQQTIVYVTTKKQSQTVLIQAFQRHPLKKQQGTTTGAHCFVPVRHILQEPEAQRALVARALQEYSAWRKRYETLSALTGLFAVADAEVEKLQEALEVEAQQLVATAK